MASAFPVTNENQHPDQVMDTTEDHAFQEDKNSTSRPVSPTGKPTIWVQEPVKETEEDKSVQSDSFSRQADVNPGYTMTVVSSRRNANGTIGSVYSGNKIRYLKKDDGIPLWRRDIQYSFLRAVFEDPTKAFTLDADGTKGHTFADIYIDAMARSSKTSKVLKEKLLSDRQSAVNMAMICLLVNVGRMNTTLNFFPEMRAQLRTYHSIPCLQVHQEPNSQYKGLQDAPRLKSILKGSCEDTDQPNTIEKIQAASIPRTNPVNLIFVLSQQAPKVSEQHFFQPRDFFDLVIRSTLSSKSRARALLWLIWWYLESDYSREAALNNPFGAGLPSEEDPEAMPIKVPAFEHLMEEQANAENIDTEEEKEYGERMKQIRKRILEEDENSGPPMKRTAGHLLNDSHTASPARSEAGRTRSPSPSGTPTLNFPRSRKNALVHQDSMEKPLGSTRLILKASRADRGGETSPVPPGAGHAVFSSAAAPHARRSRPETSHQRAVNQNRKMRADKILQKKLDGERRYAVRKKRRELPSMYRTLKRIYYLPVIYDSEDEAGSRGPGGLVPSLLLNEDQDEDFGGEAMRWKKIFDRVLRRMDRAEGGGPTTKMAIKGEGQDPAHPSSTMGRGKGGRGGGAKARAAGRRRSVQPSMPVADLGRAETLDDLDLDLLGEGGGGDEEMLDSDPNETDEADLTEVEDDFAYADPYAGVQLN